MAVDVPVTIITIDHARKLFGEGDITLAEWFVHMTCNPAVRGSKPAWAVCTLPHIVYYYITIRL